MHTLDGCTVVFAVFGRAVSSEYSWSSRVDQVGCSDV